MTGALSCAGDNTAGELGQPAPDTTVPQMIMQSGVTEVALNLTAIAPTRNTNIVAFPDDLFGGSPGKAAGSQLNVTAGPVLADLV